MESSDRISMATSSRDERVIMGAAAMLHGHLAELRAIKNAEAAWLDRFSILILPMIVFLFGTIGKGAVSTIALRAIAVSCFIFTLWFQDILNKERRSYYRVARSTVRLQNYLYLIEAALVPIAFADPFPKGFGVNPALDGTQPYSSFFRRQLFITIGFAIVISGVLLHSSELWWCAVLIALDALWVASIFHRDRPNMVGECLKERNLAGAAPEWYPSETGPDIGQVQDFE